MLPPRLPLLQPCKAYTATTVFVIDARHSCTPTPSIPAISIIRVTTAATTTATITTPIPSTEQNASDSLSITTPILSDVDSLP
nr:unnamed protein product [Spirometra erinaceieuropaei]